MWQVLAQYQSKDSSFKEFEGPIDKSPTLVFCFHPFVKEEFIDQEAQKVNLSIDPYLEKYYMPYRLKVDFNISIMHWKNGFEIVKFLQEGNKSYID